MKRIQILATFFYLMSLIYLSFGTGGAFVSAHEGHEGDNHSITVPEMLEDILSSRANV